MNKLNNYPIIIDDESKLNEYIQRYGFFRLIDGYGLNLIKITNINPITTDQIIAFFNFDNLLSNILVGIIQDFEKQLNHKIIEIVLKTNQLDNNYILEIINDPAKANLKHRGFRTFINDVYDNALQCNLIQDKQDIKKIPLRALATSWTFHTLISFCELQDKQTKIAIANEYGFIDDYDGFISVCHIIRKFRNILAHNGICITTIIDNYVDSFNYWLSIFYKYTNCGNTNINIIKLIKMLQHLTKYNIEQIIRKNLMIYNLEEDKIISLLINSIFLD